MITDRAFRFDLYELEYLKDSLELMCRELRELVEFPSAGWSSVSTAARDRLESIENLRIKVTNALNEGKDAAEARRAQAESTN